MNFKQFFTEATGWTREKFTGLGDSKAKPIKTYITKDEEELLNQWRKQLKIGDRVDLIDLPQMRPGIVDENIPIDHFTKVFGRPDVPTFALERSGYRGVGLNHIYPPGYMPGDMFRGQLNPDTTKVFDELIDEL
jgi:hypothetical protein